MDHIINKDDYSPVELIKLAHDVLDRLGLPSISKDNFKLSSIQKFEESVHDEKRFS